MTKVIFFIFKYLFALASSIYLFVFGFIFSKNRDLVYKICRHFGYLPGVVRPIIPKASISSVIDENMPIRLAGIKDDGSGMSCLEEVCLVHFLKKVNAKRIFELGTFDGLTTLNMAMNVSDEAVVYTFDLPRAMKRDAKLTIDCDDISFIDKESSGILFSGKPCSKKIVQLFGDTAQYDFSKFYKTIDMVFVDASHSYEYVKNDSLIALKLLRDKNAIIVWHDYGGSWSGVTRALNEFYVNDPDFKDILHIEGTSFVYLLRA